MKELSIVFILLLVLNVQASFFDNFRGALSNINQGFGKLFGDVVSDVKDTLFCTISAVEEVLVQNGLLDQRRMYNQRCKGIEKPKEQSPSFQDGSSHTKTISTIHKHSVIRHKHKSTRISHEEHTINNVNKTTIINDYGNANLNITDNHIAEISKIIKQESENISRNLKNDIKKMQVVKEQSPVESILEEIKFLDDLQRNSKNDTEVKEIRRVFGKITDKLNVKLDNKEVLEPHTIDKLKDELQKYINNENLKLAAENQQVFTEIKSNNTNTIVKSKTDVNDNKTNSDGRDLAQSKKSIFSLGYDSLTSFFNSMSSPGDIQDAKNLIADSQHSDRILNYFFKA